MRKYISYIIPVICFILSSLEVDAQNRNLPKGVSIYFSIKDSILKDSIQPILQIKINNKRSSSVYVLDTLAEGEIYNIYSNLSTELYEYKKGEGFVVLRKRSYGRCLGIDDSVFNLKYTKLESGKSIVLEYNLFDVFSNEILKGTYRIRFKLRIPPLLNPKSKGEMLWIQSGWFKLEVLENIRKANWIPSRTDHALSGPSTQF